MDETLLVTTRYLQGTNQPKVQTQRVKIALKNIIPMKHIDDKSLPETRGWRVDKILRGLNRSGAAATLSTLKEPSFISTQQASAIQTPQSGGLLSYDPTHVDDRERRPQCAIKK